ncbi:MAG: zf-HC2 domain-containing protein [Gemmatimonadales bacterium]|nr:zf-HC2 domain-containing protein [Gemmatimonadota bacterium]MBP6669316.1 zf-HC2 domain-containing protein [Gemmatimonadales bacterium]
MTPCTDASPLLDEYLDGTLAAGPRAEVEAHLAACAACRAELEAIGRISTAARALPAALQPPDAVWAGIASRLPAAAAPRRPTANFPWLRLAAALALFLGGYAIARLGPGAPATDAFAARRAEYTAASIELTRTLRQDAGALAPETRRVVERNLAIIDQAIGEAEAALQSDPGNGALEQMVLARYEQRLALLRHATLSGRRES